MGAARPLTRAAGRTLPRRLCGAGAVTLALGACASSTPPSVPQALGRAPAAYLLTIDDLPVPGFQVAEAAHDVSLAQAMLPGGGAAHLSSSAAAAAQDRFLRPVTDIGIANGPVDVIDTVVRYAAAGEAHTAYAAEARVLDGLAGAGGESTGALGDEAHAVVQMAQTRQGVSVLQVTLVWRVANLLNRIVVRGRLGGTGVGDALILARHQESHEDR